MVNLQEHHLVLHDIQKFPQKMSICIHLWCTRAKNSISAVLFMLTKFCPYQNVLHQTINDIWRPTLFAANSYVGWILYHQRFVSKVLNKGWRNITGARECSPVLTAIHHFNGRFCNFLLCIFQQDPWGQTPQLIVTQNGLNHADSGKDVPFGVSLKIESFCTTWPTAPENR